MCLNSTLLLRNLLYNRPFSWSDADVDDCRLELHLTLLFLCRSERNTFLHLDGTRAAVTNQFVELRKYRFGNISPGQFNGS